MIPAATPMTDELPAHSHGSFLKNPTGTADNDRAGALASGPSSADHASRITGHRNHVLVVDDLESNVRLLSAFVRDAGYQVQAAGNAKQALELVERNRPDLILMDVRMPELDGIEACRRLKASPDTRLIPVVLLTGVADTDSRIRGLEAGADDFISKPFNMHELRARVRSLLRIKRYTDALDSAEAVIISLALTIEARDSATEGHCQRLARYASALGRAVGLESDDLATLVRGAFLHDIGKVGIPDAILLKPAGLTQAEFAVMKQHPVIGDRLCAELRSLCHVRPIVRWHHERLDGSGYPDGLRGRALPLLAQIIGVVDVFDALTTRRPYKSALPVDRAYEELLKETESGWRDRELVNEFVRLGDEALFGDVKLLKPADLVREEVWCRQ